MVPHENEKSPHHKNNKRNYYHDNYFKTYTISNSYLFIYFKGEKSLKFFIFYRRNIK